jgi:hypothetical protein
LLGGIAGTDDVGVPFFTLALNFEFFLGEEVLPSVVARVALFIV